MVLIAVKGGLGSGKTIFAVREGFQYMNKNYNIYSNFHLNFPHVRLRNPQQLIAIGLEDRDKPVCVLLDEAYLWFDAYIGTRKILQFYRNLINVSRKMDFIIYMTTQSIGQINLRTRLLFDYMIEPVIMARHKYEIVDMGEEYQIGVFKNKEFIRTHKKTFKNFKKAKSYLFFKYRHDLKYTLFLPGSFANFVFVREVTIKNIQKYGKHYNTYEIQKEFMESFEIHDNKNLEIGQKTIC